MGINSDSLPPLPSNQIPGDPLAPVDSPPPIDPPIDPPPPVDPPPDPPFTNQPQPQPPPAAQPTTPPQPPTTPPPYLQAETKKGFSIKKLLFVLLIVIILLAGGSSIALAYTDYKLITPPKIIKNLADRLLLATPLPKTPRLVLEKSQAKMATVKTATLEIESELSTTSTNAPMKSAKFKIKGPFDLKNQNQVGIQLEISGEVGIEGMQLSGAGEIRQIDDYLYFKLTQVPMGSFLPLDQFKNQWFYVNVKELNQQNQSAPDEQKIQKVIEIFRKFQAKSYQWAILTSGQDKYELKINPPKEEVDNLIFEIIKVLEPKNQPQLETSIEKGNLQDFTKNLQNIGLTLKIGKKDFLIKEGLLSFSFEIEASPSLFPSAGEISLAPTTKIPISLSVTTRFSDYNQPVIVEIPDGAKDFKQNMEGAQNNLEKSLNLPPSPQNFQLPQQSTPSVSPAPESGIRDFFSSPSPVLGEKNYWDLILLNYLRQII